MKSQTQRGTSLVELSVASFLLMILLGLSYLTLVEGVDKQNGLRDEVGLQQDALALMARISRETAEGHSSTFWPDRTVDAPLATPGDELLGFVFLSPRDDHGRVRIDPSNNHPIWQKRVCYYYEPADRKVYRCEEPLAAPSSAPPPRDDTKTTDWFQANTLSDPLPGHVEDFVVRVGSEQEHLQFNASFTTIRGQKKKTLEFISSTTIKN